MPITSELKARLENSQSVKSLRAELRLISVLSANQWRCYHGAFYLDGVENKLREIDVLARQVWVRQTRGREETSRLNLIIEAKSAKDWQIVFSADRSSDETCGYTTRVWSGFIDNERYRWIINALLRAGVNEAEISGLIAKFEKRAFPNKYARMPTVVEPPSASHIVTAFRETNTGQEKDLENSVFWRAISGLRSTTKALEVASEEWHADWFADPKLRSSSSPDSVERFETISDFSLGFVDIIHPIVVMDANLWLVEAESLTPIQSCRFHQLDHAGTVTWWCDVVHTSEFSSHVESLSRVYAKAFKRSRSTLSSLK